MLFPIDFENVFILISLNISNIELKEDSDINESENFNVDIQTYLTLERKYKEFTIIGINFNITKKDNEKHLYNKNNLYLESNNVRYHSII